MTGQEVKQLILSEGVKCWQVAEFWGIADCNFSRRLRRPFTPEEVKRIKTIIAEIKAKKNCLSVAALRRQAGLTPAQRTLYNVPTDIIPYFRRERNTRIIFFSGERKRHG